jgi:hypothetical protein
MSIRSKQYRWIGLTGLFLAFASDWLGLVGILANPIGRLLVLLFAVAYWKEHKDGFSIVLLILASVYFLHGALVLIGILSASMGW